MNYKDFIRCSDCEFQHSCTNYKGADRFSMKAKGFDGLPICFESKILFRDKLVIFLITVALVTVAILGVLHGFGKV